MADEYCTTLTVTIANGQSLSDEVRIGNFLLVGIVMPPAWDPAALTFQASVDDVTYNNLYGDAGAEFSIPAAAARHIIITPADLASIQYLKVRSGTSGAPVAQTAARTIQVVVRPA